GLEYVGYGAAIIVDSDSHTENILLNFDLAKVKEKDQNSANQWIQHFKNLFNKDKSLRYTRERHLKTMEAIIHSFQSLGGCVYFHKIDHDSGQYRHCDRQREYSFKNHGTSPIYWPGEDLFPRMQPTNHMAELSVGKKEPEILILSNTFRDIVESNPIKTQIKHMQESMDTFFHGLQEQCANSIKDQTEQQRAELLLLKYYQKHILSGSKSRVTLSRSERRSLEKAIQNIKNDIKEQMIQATIWRGIALYEEYLACIKNDDNRFLEIREKIIQDIAANNLKPKPWIVQFKEGLSGKRKSVFWGGLALIGVTLGMIGFAGIIGLTGGLAIPVLLPVSGAMIGGIGLAMTTGATVSNPATKRWYQKIKPW